MQVRSCTSLVLCRFTCPEPIQDCSLRPIASFPLFIVLFGPVGQSPLFKNGHRRIAKEETDNSEKHQSTNGEFAMGNPGALNSCTIFVCAKLTIKCNLFAGLEQRQKQLGNATCKQLN